MWRIWMYLSASKERNMLFVRTTVLNCFSFCFVLSHCLVIRHAYVFRFLCIYLPTHLVTNVWEFLVFTILNYICGQWGGQWAHTYEKLASRLSFLILSASHAKIVLCIVNNIHFKYPRVVVGAPRGNSTYPEHRGIHQPGVVYQCRLDKLSLCQHLVLDSGGELCQNNFSISI
jgi:hypothetical protein